MNQAPEHFIQVNSPASSGLSNIQVEHFTDLLNVPTKCSYSIAGTLNPTRKLTNSSPISGRRQESLVDSINLLFFMQSSQTHKFVGFSKFVNPCQEPTTGLGYPYKAKRN